MLSSFFLKGELQLQKFELNSNSVCVLDPEVPEINLVCYFQHPAYVTDHPSCSTEPDGQRLWLCMVTAVLRWFF